MMGQVGGKEAFDEGRKDLEVLAGVRVTTKAVERVSEAVGEQIEQQNQRQREQVMSGKVVPFVGPARFPKMYVAMDGSGVPVVGRETEGRKGKDETGQAKTREAKLGCVFTQTRVDEEAVRDEDSTTYVGAIETAEGFGSRIYAEAVRRGIARAEQVILLGDGAKWIWGLAEEHFPGATQIVDLYHAREHLTQVAKLRYGAKSKESQSWRAARREELDAGDVEAVKPARSPSRCRDSSPTCAFVARIPTARRPGSPCNRSLTLARIGEFQSSRHEARTSRHGAGVSRGIVLRAVTAPG